MRKDHYLKKISAKLSGLFLGSLVCSSCYATVWCDDDWDHPQAEALERVQLYEKEEFHRETNEYSVLYFEKAPKTIGTLERSANLVGRTKDILNVMRRYCEASTNFSFNKENIHYYIRDVFVQGPADGRYAIDFQLPEEVFAPFSPVLDPSLSRFYPPSIAIILRTRNVFWLGERDISTHDMPNIRYLLDTPIPGLQDSSYRDFVDSLTRISEEVLSSPQFLDPNTSPPLDTLGLNPPRNRFYAYVRHGRGGEIIQVSNRQGNGRGFTTLVIMPPLPIQDRLDRLQVPVPNYGNLNIIILRTRFWFSDNLIERLIQMAIKPWLKLEATDGSFLTAILRSIQDLLAKNGGMVGAIEVPSSLNLEELRNLCNSYVRGMVGPMDPEHREPLRQAFIDCQRQITTFLSTPGWRDLDTAIRGRDPVVLQSCLNGIVEDNLNAQFEAIARMAEQHLGAINDACPVPITLTQQREFALDERNLYHLARIIGLNILYLSPGTDENTLSLEVFTKEGGEMSSSINFRDGLSREMRSTVDSLFSALETILIYRDNYGYWHAVTNELIR